MKLSTKIKTLIILFAILSGFYFLNGITIFFEGGSYGDYGNAFVYAAIFGYVAFNVYSNKNKSTYWMALFFSGLVLLRFLAFIGLSIYSKAYSLTGVNVLMVLNVIIFGVIPIYLLRQKDVRELFV